VAGGSLDGEPVAVVDFMLLTARSAWSCGTWRTLSARCNLPVEDDASRFDPVGHFLCNSDDQRQKETRYLKLREEHHVRGVLLTPVAGTDARIDRPQRRGNSMVLVDGRSPLRVQCTGLAG
jgi:hypothetical protein